ncbi:MAG TPA: glutamate-5-semialdehyde dehydrogenase, partial [Bdellovibrionales bacterium]|nr:glutamate-5-semialdehyde dehydrogenase [Bdellovibrionales bacterium]
MTDVRARLLKTREAFYKMSALPVQRRNAALEKFAGLIDRERAMLLEANKKDLENGDRASPLYQRLKLDDEKLTVLVKGIRDIVAAEDPVGRVLSRTLLDDGLVLERKSVPIGVLGIIFESRPDVIPQILSLVIKSGNACVLKGGREAAHSNAAFMKLVGELDSDLAPGWAQLLETRQDVAEMLAQSDLLDLVIPRGGNQLVQMVMSSTKVPVLGHADGVCHLYVHASADISMAMKLAIDGKTQYPSACNSIETLLVDRAVAPSFLKVFEAEAKRLGVRLKGCAETKRLTPSVEDASEADWRTEYGDLTLAVRVVGGVDEAIAHINR